MLRAAAGRWRMARGALGGYVLGWSVCTLAGGVPVALTVDHLARGLPGGSAELAAPGGAVALDVVVDGRTVLAWVLSAALGVALAFGLAVEPFLRGAVFCRLVGCGARCGARRGVVARGARHFWRLALWQVAVWIALGVTAAAAAFSLGTKALAVCPAAWVVTRVLGDAGAMSLVAAPGVRSGLRLWLAVLRRRALVVLGGGLLSRGAALLPLLALGPALAAGPGGTVLRPAALLGLPLLALLLRSWWWALLAEVVDGAAGTAQGLRAEASFRAKFGPRALDNPSAAG